MKELNKTFILKLKREILQSRYTAAKLVNKELIMLYLNIGGKIRTKTAELSWGSKVLVQISKELQNELPGLKGFSATNLKRMSLVYDFWNRNTIDYSTLTNNLQSANNKNNTISPTLSDQLQNNNPEISPTLSDQFVNNFFSASFSHHYLIASKTNSFDEANFYIRKIVVEFLSFCTR